MNFSKTILYIILSISFSTFARADWTSALRLTYTGNEFLPQIIARNDTVHVVWTHDNDFVGYLRSTDGGATWDGLITLSEEGHIATYPDLSLGDNGLFVSWQDRDIFDHMAYSTSVDGVDWAEPTHIYPEFWGHLHEPASIVKGDSIFISYFAYADDSTGEQPLRLLSSYNYGHTWNDEVTICYPYSTQQTFILKYCGTALVLVKAGFVDDQHSGYHVIGYRSDDAGQTWSDMIWISPEQLASAQCPCVTCNEETDQLAVGYMDYRFQEHAFFGDIFIAISDDGGLTWSTEVRSTLLPTATVPTIDFIGDTLVAAWSDNRYGGHDLREIFFNRSNDKGLNWLGEERLTDESYFSSEPWLIVNNSMTYLAWWNDNANQNHDIYFKRYIPGWTSVEDNSISLPVNLSLSTYPNPFNSKLKINIQVNSPGKLNIYDLLGRAVKTYEYESGISSLIWDATDDSGKRLSSGIYFARLETSAGVRTAKIVYLK